MSAKKWPVLFLIVMLTLSACNGRINTPSITPPAATPTPAHTLTPTPTRPRTLTPTSTSTALPCAKNNVLKYLKTLSLKNEIVFNYNTLNNVSTLGVWFVDAEITFESTPVKLVQNNTEAQHAAAELAIRIVNTDRCIAKLFQYINPIVVDSQYHEYFSGQVSPLIIPKKDALSEENIQAVMAAFTSRYTKLAPPPTQGPIPSGSCTWAEAEAKIHQHFSADRENVSFYLVIDESGINVWAQWDGSTDKIDLAANLLNITQELNCLFPRPQNMIYVIVDQVGNIQVIDIMPLGKK